MTIWYLLFSSFSIFSMPLTTNRYAPHTGLQQVCALYRKKSTVHYIPYPIGYIFKIPTALPMPKDGRRGMRLSLGVIIHFHYIKSGASLVVQWLRIHLTVQGFNPWSRKIPHASRQLSPCALEPAGHNSWAHALQLLKSMCLEPALCNKGSHCSKE